MLLCFVHIVLPFPVKVRSDNKPNPRDLGISTDKPKFRRFSDFADRKASIQIVGINAVKFAEAGFFFEGL